MTNNIKPQNMMLLLVVHWFYLPFVVIIAGLAGTSGLSAYSVVLGSYLLLQGVAFLFFAIRVLRNYTLFKYSITANPALSSLLLGIALLLLNSNTFNVFIIALLHKFSFISGGSCSLRPFFSRNEESIC